MLTVDILSFYVVNACRDCAFQMSDLISRLSDWSSLSSPLAPLTESQQQIITR